MLVIQRIKTSEINSFTCPAEHETVVVMPAVKMVLAQRAADVMLARTEASGLLVMAEDDCRIGFVATANFVYSKTVSQYFCYTAQDAFAGYFWLDTALETMRATGAGLLAFNDGRFFGELAAFGLVSRQWTDTLYGSKALFFPHYQKIYCDTELTDIATRTNKLAYNPHSMLIEIDYGKHRGQSARSEENTIRYVPSRAKDPDGILYVTRALGGFGGMVAPFVPTIGPVEQVLKARRQAGHSVPG
ncbi:hypothetical protein LJC59_05845 [Desulfovibrio sp. OttesenSCG-928-A18]|nr:hypothetical protein [Desulfovibrio sp. OttesenSCG-928-A18]